MSAEEFLFYFYFKLSVLHFSCKSSAPYIFLDYGWFKQDNIVLSYDIKKGKKETKNLDKNTGYIDCCIFHFQLQI